MNAVSLKTSFVLAYWLVTTWFTYRIVQHGKPGMPRALRALPVICGHLALPLLYDQHAEVVMRMTVFCMTMFSVLKIVALCLNRGPLCDPLTFWQYLAILHFPVLPDSMHTNGSSVTSPVGQQTPSSPPRAVPKDSIALLMDGLLKALLMAVMCDALATFRPPALVQHAVLGWCMWFFLQSIMDVLAFASQYWLGMRLAPLFDAPVLATSQRQFWTQRWNITASLMFRALVYDPIIEGRAVRLTAVDLYTGSNGSNGANGGESNGDGASLASPRAEGGAMKPLAVDNGTNGNDKGGEQEVRKPPPKLQLPPGPVEPPPRGVRVSHSRRLAATIAAFVLSGVCHEALFYVGQGVLSWRWFLFFALQGPVVIAESGLRKVARARGLRAPWLLQVLVTHSLVVLSTHYLFFPAADATGLTHRVLVNVKVGFEDLLRSASGLTSNITGGFAAVAAAARAGNE